MLPVFRKYDIKRHSYLNVVKMRYVGLVKPTVQRRKLDIHCRAATGDNLYIWNCLQTWYASSKTIHCNLRLSIDLCHQKEAHYGSIELKSLTRDTVSCCLISVIIQTLLGHVTSLLSQCWTSLKLNVHQYSNLIKSLLHTEEVPVQTFYSIFNHYMDYMPVFL